MTLILFVIAVTNWAMSSFTGYSLIGGDLFTLLLLVFLVLLVVSLVRPLVGKLRIRR